MIDPMNMAWARGAAAAMVSRLAGPVIAGRHSTERPDS